MAVACIVCWKTISSGVIYAADDIWWHTLWLQDFIKELSEGIFYPRWLAHSNYLYGSPTFVFYPPFCFYVGALVQKLFTLSILQTIPALFTIGTFASGLSMYLAAQRMTGKAAALAGAVMVMTAPFVTLDIYFRAALAELFSLIWLPIILLNVDQVHTRSGKNLLALGFCMLTLTHIPCLLIYTLAWLTRLGYYSVRTTNGAARLKQNLLYALLGLGCGSFYLLPVLMEQNLVNIAAVLDRNPWEVNLLFSPDYRGFFPIADIAIKSCATAILLYAATYASVRSKKNTSTVLKESAYWLAMNVLTLFLMSNASGWLWHNIKIIQFLQFPWRLMTVNLFSTAMLFAICLRWLPSASLKKYMKILLGALLVSLVMQQLSSDYFITKYRSGLDKPEAYMVMDSAALKVAEFARYEMPKLLASPEGYPGVPEYTPVVGTTRGGESKSLPHAVRGRQLLTFVDGAGTISVVTLKSYLYKFSTDSPEHITFKMRIYHYPAWHLYMDGKSFELKAASDGEILITAPRGKHQFQLKYEYTTAFQWGIALSLLSASALFWLNLKRVKPAERQTELNEANIGEV
jgi:hypothetical protein